MAGATLPPLAFEETLVYEVITLVIGFAPAGFLYTPSALRSETLLRLELIL